MEKGTGVKENYGKSIFDIDINPCYVRKTKTFFAGNHQGKNLKVLYFSNKREQENGKNIAEGPPV